MWPLSRYPEILPRGEAFVRKWGVPCDLHRPLLRAVAGLGAARRRHFRDVLLAVPDRQFRLGAGLVGRPAAVRRRDGENRRMAVAGGVGQAGISRWRGVLAPGYLDRSHLRAAVAWPSSRYRRNAGRTSAATRTKGTSKRVNPANRIHRLTGRTSHGTDTTSRTRRRRGARRHAALAEAPANGRRADGRQAGAEFLSLQGGRRAR